MHPALLLCLLLLQRDGKGRADISAHSRFLSAMDIHPTKDLIVTVAEDCTLNVWALPIGGAKVRTGRHGRAQHWLAGWLRS